mgnify:CR=1 FL=1
MLFFFFQAEDGIRDLVRSRGLGDVYKRQSYTSATLARTESQGAVTTAPSCTPTDVNNAHDYACLLYTSDAADERSSVDLGGRRIIKKKNSEKPRNRERDTYDHTNKDQIMNTET